MSAIRYLAEEIASSLLRSQEVSGKDVTECQEEEETCREDGPLPADDLKLVEQGYEPLHIDADNTLAEEAEEHLAQVGDGITAENSSALERRPSEAKNEAKNDDEVQSSVASAEIEAITCGLQNADLEGFTELGSGTFGKVCYGKWRGSDVAIK